MRRAGRVVHRRGPGGNDTALELMVAVRPTFHNRRRCWQSRPPTRSDLAGTLALNVVSSWWSGRGAALWRQFEQHDDRYARTAEWLQLSVKPGEPSPRTSFSGKYYKVEDSLWSQNRRALPARHLRRWRIRAAKSLIARDCDAYVMHGDPPERIAENIADMRRRRERSGLPPMQYGVAGTPS